MSLRRIERRVGIDACERRFHSQRILLIEIAASRQVTSEGEALLASHIASLNLLRTRLQSRLAGAPTNA